MLKKNKLKVYIFFFLFIIGLLFLFFNEYGIIKYIKLKSEIKSLNEEILTTDKEGKSLEVENDSLRQKIPAKIEKTAREKYGMSRKGEKVIEVKEK